MFLDPISSDFAPVFEVVGCYVRSRGEILLLRRNLNKKRQPGLWGFPAGRVDEGEDKISAMIRELKEETGIQAAEGALHFHESIPVRNTADVGAGYDLWYHVFEIQFGDERPEVKISEEHTEYRWVRPLDVLQLEYLHDIDSCIQRHTFLRD